jgi:ketosteroid isomerase-like protein
MRPRIAVIALVGTMCTSAASAQQINWNVPPHTSAERAVARLDSLRLSALLEGDTTVVRRIYADDFRSILPSGRLRTKPEFLRDLAAGQQRYDTVYHAGQRIEVVGEVAIITGRSTQRGREARTSAPLVAETRYVRVYAHRGGRWQLLYTQLTAISDSSPVPAS